MEIILNPSRGVPRRDHLSPAGDGFFSLRVPDAKPGWRYSYLVDGEGPFPDPASRFQPEDCHAPSEVIDPAFAWSDHSWRGLEWKGAVIYELHVGAFTPEGTFSGILSRLDHLAQLGITTIELMPIADFPGERNWGYDGAFLFAPDSSYGRPEDLKRLIDVCHSRGIGVILDVVYNHFGPDGNYLWPISRAFFNPKISTPWGEGIDISHPVVSAYFEQNARFWVEEYHFDGLRLDAVHALDRRQRTAFLRNIQRSARAAAPDRRVSLILENVDNQANLLMEGNERVYDAQWNDNFHTALHALLTGERGGHYGDHPVPEVSLERAIAEGFVFQGQYSDWHKRPLGSSCTGLPFHAFVYFLQTHDMCGNRAFGERLHQLVPVDAYRAAVALYLFLPGIPMLFMGEEFLASTPFLFFCDHKPELGQCIREGRVEGHVAYEDWGDPMRVDRIPDPQAESTFRASCLNWTDVRENSETVEFYRRLLELRAEFMPHMRRDRQGLKVMRNGRLFSVVLKDMEQRDALASVVNLGPEPRALPEAFDPSYWQRLLWTKPWKDALVPAYAAAWFRRR